MTFSVSGSARMGSAARRSRPTRRSCSDRSGSTIAYRTIVNARTGAILARTNLTDNFSNGPRQARQRDSDVHVQRRARRDRRGLRRSARPVHGRPRRPGAVRLRGRDDQHERRVLKLFFGDSTTPLIAADTLLLAGAVPLRTGRRRASGRLLRPGLRLPGRRCVGRAADVHRHRHDRRQPGSARLLGALEGLPGHAAAAREHMYPWGNPSTDTRKTWCWRSAPGCDIVVGNLASRVPWDYDGRTNTTTFTTSGNNNKAATSWDNASAPSASALHADEQPPGTTRSRGRTTGTTGSASGQPRRPRAPSTTTPQRP